MSSPQSLSSNPPVSPRVLVLGAGQLGLMLAEAGARLGLVVDRYDPERELLLPGTSDLGLVLDEAALLARYGVITVEREHFPAHGLVHRLLESPRCAVGSALATLSDRAQQKQLLERLGIPTAPWQILAMPADLRAAQKRWGAVVVKSRKDGYDGRGTRLLESGASESGLPSDAIVEARIPFRRELSLVAARNARGELSCYPLVENQHVAGMLRVTHAPADEITEVLQQEAEGMAATLMEAMSYRGVLTLELFDTERGLMVNEVAPRVHNSGHWTQDGSSICQFELHLRALLDLPLPTPMQRGPVAMLNLVGTGFKREWLQRPGRLHWYNKAPRPERKQGHVNFCGRTRAELATQLLAWQDQLPNEIAPPDLDAQSVAP